MKPSCAFVASLLLALGCAESVEPGLRNNLAEYGLEQMGPGVIGAHFSHCKNADIIEGSLITRMNTKLQNKLSGSLLSRAKRMKDKVAQIVRRAADAKDAAPPTTASSTSKKYLQESMQNKLTYYLMNITMGTPPQAFMVQVDTGSSDLWVPGRVIQFNGYDNKHSSTYKHLNDDFKIEYVKDSAKGYWAVDTFGFGGTNVTVHDMQFAVATSAPDATMGILGIGPVESEVSPSTYPNLPEMLAREGLISRAVYSMHMGGIESNGGTILFGGTDKAKYRKLTTLPIVSKSTIQVQLDLMALTASEGPVAAQHKTSQTKLTVYESEHGYYPGPERNVTELVGGNDDTIVSQTPVNVLLDTGTSLSYLPSTIVQAIATAFKAEFESSVGMYVVHQRDLALDHLRGINFQFGNQIIYMPKEELFWPLSWFSLEPSPYYAMTMLSSDGAMGYNILGDSFLRNAYVIYDLAQKEVHIGQYYPSKFSHIIPI